MTQATATTARDHMIQSQILTGHVLDPQIIEALGAVDRAAFAPPALRGAAYLDEEVPLGRGRFLLEPLVFARLLKYADLQPGDTVLDVACGTGYSAAVLSRIVRRVVCMENAATLVQAAVASLASFPNVRLVTTSFAGGSAVDAPYDVIFIEGGIEHIPPALCDQLREGGRLLTVEHEAASRPGTAGLGKIARFEKTRGQLYKTLFHDAQVRLLDDFRAPSRFAL